MHDRPNFQTHLPDYLPKKLVECQEQWRKDCFPDSQASSIVWRKADLTLWAFTGFTPTSTLQILVHTVIVGGTSIEVCGIAGVMTAPRYQGQGYASALMHHAVDLIQDQQLIPFGLLGCHEPTIPFYERLGWQRLAAEFTFEQPGGLSKQCFPWVDVPMILPLNKNEDVPWPSGDIIDFNGLPW